MFDFACGCICGMVITFFGDYVLYGRKSGPEKLMWR